MVTKTLSTCVRFSEGIEADLTLAPAATAFLTSIWHWARLWDMLAVEHI